VSLHLTSTRALAEQIGCTAILTLPWKTARRTLRGIEAISMIRKGQAKGISRGESVSQAKFIEELLGISA